jgi:hypothetical protein
MRSIRSAVLLLALAIPGLAQFGSNATSLRGWRICNPPEATKTDGHVLTWDGTNACWKSAAGGGGGGSVNVNGSSVSSPNFNGTTPAAAAGYTNGTFQVSSSSVSVEVPQRTLTVTFLTGMGGLYAGEPMLVKWSAPCGPSSTGTTCVDQPVTIIGCSIDAMTYPTGSSAIIDVLATGTTTIFSGSNLVLPDGGTTPVFQAAGAAAAVVHSQGWLVLSVVQAGATIAGKGINVVCPGVY